MFSVDFICDTDINIYFFLPYLELKDAVGLSVVDKRRIGIQKIKVCMIEQFYKAYLIRKWVANVQRKVSIYSNRNITHICKFCKKRWLSVGMKLKFFKNRQTHPDRLLFSCESCFSSLETEVIYSLYPIYVSVSYTEYCLHDIDFCDSDFHF